MLQHPWLPSNDCPTLFVFCLRELGKDFSLNASFTARCSGSTKSIHILNRKQRMKHVEEQARQSMGAAAARSPGQASHPSQARCQRLWLKQGAGLVSVYLSSVIGVPVRVGLWILGNSGQIQFGEKLIDPLGYSYHILIPQISRNICWNVIKRPWTTFFFPSNYQNLLKGKARWSSGRSSLLRGSLDTSPWKFVIV